MVGYHIFWSAHLCNFNLHIEKSPVTLITMIDTNRWWVLDEKMKQKVRINMHISILLHADCFIRCMMHGQKRVSPSLVNLDHPTCMMLMYIHCSQENGLLIRCVHNCMHIYIMYLSGLIIISFYFRLS